MISYKNNFIFIFLFCALFVLTTYNVSWAAKGGRGGSGSHSGGSSGGHDTDHGDEHAEEGSDSHEGGKGKGPKYYGGRGTKVGHGSSSGHSVEDKIFHGKQGKRWSDDWSKGGDDHGEDADGHDHED